MTSDQVRELFPVDKFETMRASKHGTLHLFFGNGGIDVVRQDCLDKRDPRLWINKYKRIDLPPYELLLVDISDAISEFKRQSENSRSRTSNSFVGIS